MHRAPLGSSGSSRSRLPHACGAGVTVLHQAVDPLSVASGPGDTIVPPVSEQLDWLRRHPDQDQMPELMVGTGDLLASILEEETPLLEDQIRHGTGPRSALSAFRWKRCKG